MNWKQIKEQHPRSWKILEGYLLNNLGRPGSKKVTTQIYPEDELLVHEWRPGWLIHYQFYPDMFPRFFDMRDLTLCPQVILDLPEGRRYYYTINDESSTEHWETWSEALEAGIVEAFKRLENELNLLSSTQPPPNPLPNV